MVLLAVSVGSLAEKRGAHGVRGPFDGYDCTFPLLEAVYSPLTQRRAILTSLSLEGFKKTVKEPRSYLKGSSSESEVKPPMETPPLETPQWLMSFSW
jgi:hypothetical protein